MPAKPKLATTAASEVRFPTWDELVAEARVNLPPYQLPLPDGTTVEIPVFNGDQYMTIAEAQRFGDVTSIFNTMFPDAATRGKVRAAMKGADVHFPIMDRLATKVLRYFYGLGIEIEEQSGNSPAS